MADPFGIQRDRVKASIEQAERSLYRRALDLLSQWASRLHSAVFGRGRHVDPAGVFETEGWFRAAVDDVVVEVKDIYEHAHDDVVDDDPEGYRLAREFLRESRNRLVRVPDSVYSLIRREVFTADRDGSTTDELADRIDQILSVAGSDRWTNRAMVIARTEATAAFNAGTFSGYLGYAAQAGGPWEKTWLTVHDDRVRHTHVKADGQRVPLILPFSVGGFPGMFPGDPELPAKEVVNCRCGTLLVRPGEMIDYSNRNYRGA